ncbi:MAG: winged helix-turn-helix domain-containing protein [Gemmatimonadaceae bacterium]|nr:winged helix-turn-helix domain-containing protein [Gemmatimonadaceae bacterium]
MGEPLGLAVHRSTRTLIGPTGARVELPWLTLQLLSALSEHQPAFVDAKRLQALVWPDTHISPDALKQRVRLARQVLREAGYDPALLDSVRGEGYALRVPLVDAMPDAMSDTAPAISGNADAQSPTPDAVSPVSSRYRVTWWQRWRIAVVGALIFTAAVVAEAIGNWRSSPGRPQPLIGPVPVRVGIATSTIGDPAADEAARTLAAALQSALANHDKVLSVPMSDPAACDTSAAVHLCARSMAGAASVRMSVTDRRSGASLIDAEWQNATMVPSVFAQSAAHTQVALLLSPGVLRWIGGPSPVGDRDFASYLTAVRAFTTCDTVAWHDAIADLATTNARAPQFRSARALALVLQGASNAEVDARVLIDSAHTLLGEEPNLALARAAIVVAHTRGSAHDSASAAFQQLQRMSPGIASGTERALRCITRESPSPPRVLSR